MKNLRKLAVLALSILVILACIKTSFAAQIQTPTSNNTSTNQSDTNTANTANEASNNANTSNSTLNGTTTSNTMNATHINTTNASENLPSTGVEDAYLNLALIILLTVVLGMFSLVQYRRIIKREKE